MFIRERNVDVLRRNISSPLRHINRSNIHFRLRLFEIKQPAIVCICIPFQWNFTSKVHPRHKKWGFPPNLMLISKTNFLEKQFSDYTQLLLFKISLTKKKKNHFFSLLTYPTDNSYIWCLFYLFLSDISLKQVLQVISTFLNCQSFALVEILFISIIFIVWRHKKSFPNTCFYIMQFHL